MADEKVKCPECDAELSFDEDVEKGEIIQCPECGLDLEVTKADPIKVEVAPEEEEDWGE